MKINSKRVESASAALVEDIYATALGDQPWEPVLHGIRQLTGARLVSLMTLDGTGLPMMQKIASDDVGWADELRQSYNAEFHGHDPTGQVVANWAAGRWYDDREWNLPEKRTRSVFHQEFFPPRDAGYWEGTFLHRTETLGHFLSLVGRGGRQDEVRSYRDQIAGIQAHLGRAIRMQARLDELQGQVAQGEAALDALTAPLFLLDEQRRLLRTNAAARALMAREPALRFVQGCFAPAGSLDPASWQAACERGVVVIPCKAPGTRPLVLTLIPVPAQASLARDRQRPLTLMLGSGARSATERQRHLCVIYGLTAAEAAICIQLCDEGLSPQACADVRQVLIGTIRSQIKSIYFKTGVTRLPELVRLVASL
ncbi:MAG: helix-turn-helix transcriptional regulator [Pseudomonadota bacterium]